MLEKEITNIVFRYYFGFIEGTYEPRFPIAGFHNDDYCDLFVKHCISKIYRDFPLEKITKYLLVKQGSNDESNFFNLHGYDFSKSNELYEQIMDGTDFSKMKYQKNAKYGIYIVAPTKIYSYKHRNYIYIKTIWLYKTDKKMHFITVNLERE